MACYSGKKLLGKRRFEIYSHLAGIAVQNFRTRQDKLSRANWLRRSGLQLSQLSLLSDLVGEEGEQQAKPTIDISTQDEPGLETK